MNTVEKLPFLARYRGTLAVPWWTWRAQIGRYLLLSLSTWRLFLLNSYPAPIPKSTNSIQVFSILISCSSSYLSIRYLALGNHQVKKPFSGPGKDNKQCQEMMFLCLS